MSNEDDECDSSSLFTVASQSNVNSFLRSQAAKITGRTGTSSLSDDEESSMDGSLLARFTQIPTEKKFSVTNPSTINSISCISPLCLASIVRPSPMKTSSQKLSISDDLTELKWLHTFKLKEFNPTDNKEKDSYEIISSNDQSGQNQQQQQQQQNNDEDRLAKLISELKLYDHESTKINTISFGILLFLALYSKRDEKYLSWSLTIKQLYEFAQSNAKQITTKRGWKNSLRQALITIPCFVKTKRDLLKSRSLWTIDPYYRPLLTKAYLTPPPVPSPSSNKTLSESATNRHEEQDGNRSLQSMVNNFAPKATVKTKVLPRLYERLCEEKDDDNDDDDEADSNNHDKQHRNFASGRKRPRSSSTSPWTSKLSKRQKHRHHRSSDVEPKTSTPNRTSNSETRTSTVVTPCPSLDHTYLLQTKKLKISPKKPAMIERTGSIEYEDDDDEEEDTDDDDERDSSSIKRKSIVTTRAQAASRSHSKNRRKSSPPKKHLPIQYPSHRPNTRINRKIIEHDLKLLRQANVLPPLSPPTNQQPLDLSLGPNRSSSYEDTQEKTSPTIPIIDETIQTKPIQIEGVLDLSLSR